MSRHTPAHTPHWVHEPLEETLDGARPLSVSVADRMVRSGWEALARVAGIPQRRWRAHHPLPAGSRLVALVDGRPAFDAAAWVRFASLVPGAVALPTRTARSLGVPRTELRPPGRTPLRIVDLLRARRVRARMRRAERSLEAAHAMHRAAVDRAVESALAPGEDGTALAALPTYALAARLELLLGATADWEFPALVDLLAARATTHLLQLLEARGLDPDAAFARAAELQAGGGAPATPHLDSLAAIDDAPAGEQDRLAARWADSVDGWHASRDLILEAPPLRDDLAAARRAAAGVRDRVPHAQVAVDLPEDDAELRDAATRSRTLVAMRERVARDRARHVAAIRALAWTIARSLHADGSLEDVDDAFGLEVADLLLLARGGSVAGSGGEGARVAPRTAQPAAAAEDGSDSGPAATPREVRGIPASRGRAAGRVVVLDEPALDADVDGAVLVCRVTDPAWLPLMLRCAALVTERGGPLSHAAIVARELGLPAVVGAAGVCAAARRASSAQIDGTTGTVTFSVDR